MHKLVMSKVEEDEIVDFLKIGFSLIEEEVVESQLDHRLFFSFLNLLHLIDPKLNHQLQLHHSCLHHSVEPKV